MNDVNNSSQQKTHAKIRINEKWCKKCGICISFCPQGVYAADEFGAPVIKFPEKCVRCMLCVSRCPDFAIDIEGVER